MNSTPQFDESALPPIDRPDMVAPDPMVASLEPIAVGSNTACALLSVSQKTLSKLETLGLPVFRMDGKKLYPVADMRRWISEQAKTK